MEIKHTTIIEDSSSVVAHSLERRADVVQGKIEIAALNSGVSIESSIVKDSEISPAETLPTDLVTYLMIDINDLTIAPKILELITDGRVHMILVLSIEEIPKKDCVNNLALIPMVSRKVGRIYVVDDKIMKEHMATDLVQAFQFKEYAPNEERLQTHANALMTQLLHKKRQHPDDVNWN